MNKVLITNYTSDTTDITDIPIYVQYDALLMHEKTPREVTRSQCSLPIVLYVHTQDYDNYAHENPQPLRIPVRQLYHSTALSPLLTTLYLYNSTNPSTYSLV